MEKSRSGAGLSKVSDRLDLGTPRTSTSVCPCLSSVFQGVGTMVSADSALERPLVLDIKEGKNPRQWFSLVPLNESPWTRRWSDVVGARSGAGTLFFIYPFAHAFMLSTIGCSQHAVFEETSRTLLPLMTSSAFLWMVDFSDSSVVRSS